MAVYEELTAAHDALPPLVTDEQTGEEVRFDCICLGTGLKECVVSGLLSSSKRKVLHLDRHDYYGADTTSVTLKDLYQKHRGDGSLAGKFGRDKDWCIDLIPKILMATGKLIKVLIYTDVHRYVEFKQIEGSYVCKRDKASFKVSKVPANETEALKSDLLGMLEKRRFKNFLNFVDKFDQDDPTTFGDCGHPGQVMMIDLMKKYSLAESTMDFVGHAIALHTDNSYLYEPYGLTVKKMKLYFDSLMQYGSSPYLYPMYGLGELPQGFARLSARFGGTYMLRAALQKILMKDGKFAGVIVDGKIARANQCACDPSYVADKVKQVYQVVRAIVILDHPPACVKPPVDSCQIIIPNNQCGRNSDIYVCCVGWKNEVAPKGYYIAIVATMCENGPNADIKEEVKMGVEILGKPIDTFYSLDNFYEPIDNGQESQIFVSSSYDPTTHFETTSLDIVKIYEAMTGEKMDFDKLPHKAPADE